MIKEGEKTELKESLSKESGILKSACAFANTSGGIIYIGIRDNGTVKGVTIGKNTMEQLARKFTENITPPLYVSIREETIKDKTVLRVEVPRSEYKPHFYKGIAYRRVGKIDKGMSPEELSMLFRSRFLEEVHFGMLECKDAALEDIDESSIKLFAEKIGVKFISVEHTLKSLKLLKKGKLLNAAVLFFGKDPAILFPLYGVKCAVFSGREILKIKDFRENIFVVVDKVVDFIMKQVPKRISFEKAERKEVSIIPRPALREAVVNALIHRDYTFPSSAYISIYEDRIEIKNPGVLPPELDTKDLYKEHPSHPRNPLLAELAHKVKFIEHWGTGTLRIIDNMRAVGLEDPIFKQEKGFFYVILPMTKPKLNKRQVKILNLLQKKGKINISQLRIHFKKAADRTIRKDIKELLEEGFMIKKGKGRKTYYTIYTK